MDQWPPSVACIPQEVVEIGFRLELTTRQGPKDWKILQINGEIDLSTAESLEDRFDEMIEAGDHHLIADLDGVGFMDSTGVSVLAKILKRVRDAGGDMMAVCGQGPARIVLAASGLDRELTVREEMPTAEDG